MDERQHAEQILAQLPGPGHSIQPVDVCSEDSIHAAVAVCLTKGALAVVVNSAGVLLPTYTPEAFQHMVNVHVKGAWRVLQACLPSMVHSCHGRIVFLSSGFGTVDNLPDSTAEVCDPTRLTIPAILAFQHRPEWEDLLSASPFGGYSISKALLNTLVRRFMAFERAFMDQHDVLISLVCPGWCRTAMGGHNAPRSAEKGAETPAHLATVPKGHPNGLLYRDLRVIGW